VAKLGFVTGRWHSRPVRNEALSVKLKFAFAAAVLALCGAAAQAQPAAPSSHITELPGVSVEPKSGAPAAPCKEADRSCYALVANELKTKYPDVYWKMAQRCMAEETELARRHADPLVDGSATVAPPIAGGYGEVGDINPQNPGERTFCAIAQSDAKPPKARK
jgi:hypothetical protein